METLNKIDQQNNEQSVLTNKLLLEVVQNQKTNAKHLVRVFITTIVCYTVLLAVMVIGFFVYESQFETTEWQTITTQEADSEGDGIAIVNNNGDWSYGESESSNDNQR